MQTPVQRDAASYPLEQPSNEATAKTSLNVETLGPRALVVGV